MKRRVVALGCACLVAGLSSVLFAQAGQATGAVLTHIVPPPTGPMTAITKAAAAVRAARAAASSAARTSGAAAGAALSRTTSVMGYLWTSQNGPIANASVQLRNTVTGAVVGSAKTDIAGQFVFQNIDGGEYVVEYVNQAATQATTTAAKDLIALGHPFSVAPGETVATFVRLSSSVPLLVPDLAQNVAASAVQTAASAGVTAIATPIAPVEQAPPPPPTEPPTGPIPPAVSAVR